MKNNFKRCLALLMALMMIVGAFAIPVSAADSDCEHDYEKIVKAPTCTTVGYTTYICKLCNDSYIEDIQNKLEHNYVKATAMKQSTCTKPGYIAGAMVCANCGDVKDGIGALPVNPANHTFDESKTYTKGPQCGSPEAATEKAYTYKWCVECSEANKNNATKGFIITGEATVSSEHSIVTTIVKPVTCGSTGEVKKACEYCDYIVDITIIETPHKYDDANFVIANKNVTWKDGSTNVTTKFEAGKKDKVEADKGGYHVKVWYCEICNEVAKAEQAAHTYQTPADKGLDVCNNPGGYNATCKDCKDVSWVKVDESHTVFTSAPKTVVESKHTATEVVVGYKVYVCQVCGEDVKYYDNVSYTADAHNPAKYAATNNPTTLYLEITDGGYYVAPTCTEVGYGKYVCQYPGCGFYKVAEIKALGHDFNGAITETGSENNCVTGYKKVQKCTRCSAEKVLKETAPVALGSNGHKKVELKNLNKAATCFEAGYKAYGCAACGEHKDLRVTQNQLTGHENKYTYWDNGETGCFAEKISYTKCSKCTTDLGKDVIKEVKVIYNSHLYETNAEGGKELEPATCSTSGKWGYECTRTCIGTTPNTTGKAEIKCGGREVTKTLEFDKNNHLGGKVKELTKGTYDYKLNGVDKSVTLETGKLADVTEAKTGKPATYSCFELSYTWWYCESCDKEFEKVSEYKDGKNTYQSGKQQHVYVVDYDLNDDGKVDDGLKEATCLASGIGTMVCKVPGCTAKLEKQPVAALGHDIEGVTGTTVIPASCITLGKVVYECARGCGSLVEKTAATKLDKHSYEKTGATPTYTVTLKATCTAKGSEYTTCTVAGCGATKIREIAMAKHGTVDKTGAAVANNFETLGKAATCTETGIETHYKCKACNQLYTQASNGKQTVIATPKTLNALGHGDQRNPAVALQAGAQVVPAFACASYTYTPNYCTFCGVERTWTGFVFPEDHTPITKIEADQAKPTDKAEVQNAPAVYKVDAECYAYAYTYNKCKICDAVFNKEDDKTVARPHHVNADGYPLIGDCRVILGDEDCTVCKGTGVDDTGANCATCIVKYTCANKKADGTTACAAVIPAQHEYVNETEHVECNAKVSECKFCGLDKAEPINAALPYSHEYVVVVEPTLTTEGVEKCVDCDYENPEKLPKLPAVVFSLEATNPNGGNIVNGGTVYVTIKLDALKIDVNNIRVAVAYDKDHLVFKGAVKSTSIFGELSVPVANAKDGVAYVFDDAGSERNNITIEGEMDFVTLEFYVKPEACDAKNRLTSLVTFVEPDDEELANSVMYYDVEADEYDTYNFDITTNDMIDLKIDQLGDFDNNGKVNNYDLVAVRDAITNGNAYDAVLDIDHDGEITIIDYKYIKEYMVATYDYWMFADLVSYNEWLAVKKSDVAADNSVKYYEWLFK